MITQITGFRTIKKLYLQLLYQCNFYCQHCFHGSNLQRKEIYSTNEVADILSKFRNEFHTREVCLLGGEPFLHPDIFGILNLAKAAGFYVEVCTNGYRIDDKLVLASALIDDLRISVDGLSGTHDSIRKAGSFEECIRTFSVAKQLGIGTSATMTITKRNATELLDIARNLKPYDVRTIKLHSLRILGNASHHSDLVPTRGDLESIIDQAKIAEALTGINVILDSDLANTNYSCSAGSSTFVEDVILDRVELQPSGELYISCKAVGDKSNAFWYDRMTKGILYRPAALDELATQTRQVLYRKAGEF